MSSAATAAPPAPLERMSYEEFLHLPSDIHAEWVAGEVVPMPSVSLPHDAVTTFLVAFIQGFLDERPLGRLLKEPFQLHLPRLDRGRAPDLMVLLSEHMGRLRDLFVEAPADLVIEVVSPSNRTMDYIVKFREYEAAGVPEYWILDPQGPEAHFFVLDAGGRYEEVPADASGVYHSTVLPGFWLKTAWLWDRPPVRQVLAELLGD